MRDYQTILLEKDSGIASIILNQPDNQNRITEHMFQELLDAFRNVATDDSINVVIIRATGDIFSAGVDLREHFLAPLEEFRRGELNIAFQKSFSEKGIPEIINVKKPIIAEINGPAVGLGFTLCLPCDLRIASEKAKIILGFFRIGISPEFGSTYFLTRLIGISKSLEILYRDQPITAEQALEMGLLNKVVPSSQLHKETMKIAEKIAKGPQVAIRLARECILNAINLDLMTALRIEKFAYNTCRQTYDHEEGVKAFLKKTKPVFKGN